jgi:hypothetical protein
MEEWELDFHWLRVRTWLKEKFDRTDPPDMKTVLFIIGVQEYGEWGESFTKEEKQDLMHVATCVLLSRDGFYTFTGLDDEGWPHFDLAKKLPFKDLDEQERFLKIKVIEYLDEQIGEEEE